MTTTIDVTCGSAMVCTLVCQLDGYMYELWQSFFLDLTRLEMYVNFCKIKILTTTENSWRGF